MFASRLSTRLGFFTVILVSLGIAAGVSADDWPNWRGPNHDGISPEKSAATKWETAPPVLWRQPIGPAFSAITCVDDHVYTCGTQDGQQMLFCLNANDGQVVWNKPLEPEYNERMGGDGPRGTPTIDDGCVYIQGAQGKLYCCDAKTGEEIWTRQFNAVPQWGYSGSVVIADKLALIIGGDDDGPFLGLDKKTGKTVWKYGGESVGYSTPHLFTLDGHKYAVGFLGKSISIVDLTGGKEVFTMPWQTDYDVNASTPIVYEDKLFISSGYRTGSALLQLKRTGDKLEATELWKGKAIMAKFQTPVLYEGHLYTSDQNGFKCVDFATGEVKWNDRHIKHGTIAIAEGNLFLLTERGELKIGPASPVGFTPTTDVRVLKGRCWTVPTLINGRLYARNLEEIVCFDLKK